MSSKSVAEKLFIKNGKKVAFFNPPENNEELLGGIPDDIQMAGAEQADILLAYIEDQSQLYKHLESLKNRIAKDGALWIAYHKGSSPVNTDINRDTLVKYATKNGLKGVAMISINKDWSALRLKIVS